MKHVSILVPEQCILQAIADPQYCFSAVNEFLVRSGSKPLFRIELVGAGKEVRLGNYAVYPDRLIHEVSDTDLVFIPALSGDFNSAINANSDLVPWIKQQYQRGAEVASLCVGAFLLGATGLLSRKKCSTHWSFQETFRNMYPDVEVQNGQIVTEEDRIYSSGGANSYWNLLLHLVEKYTNRQTAILTSKYFAIDIDRSSQAAFSIFKGQKSHNDECIKLAQEYLEKNISERIYVAELADHFAVGRRSFERRFREATNNSVLEYIQRLKIEAAKRSLETSRKSISEIMFDVGYSDTKAFRTTFKKITGLTPIGYRSKYNKQYNKEYRTSLSVQSSEP